MKKVVNDVIGKSEIQFWIGVISIILSVATGYFKLTNDISLLRQDVMHLSAKMEEVNGKFTRVHTDNARQEILIARIMDAIGLK